MGHFQTFGKFWDTLYELIGMQSLCHFFFLTMTQLINFLFPQAEMSILYFSKLGRSLFFLVLVVYLFGDLAIYCATVAKSLVNIVW